jgi:hypothetical protein
MNKENHHRDMSHDHQTSPETCQVLQRRRLVGNHQFIHPDKPDSSSQEFLTDADAAAIYNANIT